MCQNKDNTIIRSTRKENQVSNPIGSLKDLQKLLDGQEQYIYEQRIFPFYGVLLYTPNNGVNGALHNYVKSNPEFFHTQTGDNWRVAVLEDITNEHFIDGFKPEEVYIIARYLGVPVDQIPAFVIFTEPKERKETLIVQLGEIDQATNEDIRKVISTIAAKIDDICENDVPSDGRLAALHKALSEAWKEDPVWAFKFKAMGKWLATGVVSAATIVKAINDIVVVFAHLL